MPPINQPFQNFESAAKEILNYLHQETGFGLWMVTRVVDDDWLVLTAEDHFYNVNDGDVFKWADSFCSQMVRGNGPRCAPNSDSIPAYLNATIGQQIKIGAYFGEPISLSDGSLFGTMCAVHPTTMPESISAHQPLIALLAGTLSTILDSELRAEQQVRIAERAEMRALTEPLTGLHNRGGWDMLLKKEDARIQRYGNPACLVSIDLDGLKLINDSQGHAAGDNIIKAAASQLMDVVRESDGVARLGGDEFAILAVECDEIGAESLIRRLREKFQEAGLEASIGYGCCRRPTPLSDILEIADQKMYEDKRARKNQQRPCRHEFQVPEVENPYSPAPHLIQNS